MKPCWPNIQQINFAKNQKLMEIFSMEKMSAQIKLTAPEKYELEIRQNKRANSKYWLIQLIIKVPI